MVLVVLAYGCKAFRMKADGIRTALSSDGRAAVAGLPQAGTGNVKHRCKKVKPPGGPADGKDGLRRGGDPCEEGSRETCGGNV